MSITNKLRKEYETFCKLGGGNFSDKLGLECSKFGYTIKINYLDLGEDKINLNIQINSAIQDFEVLSLKNVKILDVERLSQLSENNNELSYYVLNIYLDIGILSLKKDIKNNKIIISLKTGNIEYQSSVIF